MEFFMGQELVQPELPVNSPRPPETPPEGVIAVDRDLDGTLRRYLYKSMNGEISETLISETKPAVKTELPFKSTQERPLQAPAPTYAPAPAQPARMQTMGATKQAAPPRMQATPIKGMAPNADLRIQSPLSPRVGEMLGLPMREEQPSVIQKASPLPVDGAVMEKKSIQMQGSLGGPTSFLEKEVRMVGMPDLVLGNVPQKQISPGAPLGSFPMAGRTLGETSLAQAQPAAPATPAEAAAPPLPPPGQCPGAVEMTDGRIIEPQDEIRLQDLCELMPFLLESYKALETAKQSNGKVAPGQSVPVVGQQRGPGGVPSTASQFGPAGGMSPYGGGGGGGFVGGGGGGPGPVGPQGQVGAQGPIAPGGIVDSITKTDGDFSAGPGAFVPVPGTSIMFVQGTAGPATFLLNANLGATSGASGLSQSGQMGLRIDGTDYPLVSRLLHTFAGGVGEFILAQPAVFSLPLPAGPHTVEVILRGLAPGEFGGAAIGIPASVAASPIQPLHMSVTHN